MPLADVHSIERPIGTDAYMAPEQCDPGLFTQIGPAADVWGLGVTLFESLMRTRPFPEPRDEPGAPLATRYPQLAADPPPMFDVPTELSDIVLSCLEKSPGDRPTACDLGEALEPWVSVLPRPRLGLFRPGGRIRSSVFESP
jgi:serine/threonine protein kinase